MKINLNPIYAGLEAWRDERRLTTKSQKDDYIVNVMEEFGELAQALRDYEKYTDYFKDCVEPFGYEGKATNYEIRQAEHAIIDALCDIAVFTINAWGKQEPKEISTIAAGFDFLLANCAEFNRAYRIKDFENVLITCATLCDLHGYNFQVAMLETIKELNSRTGSYDEIAKKWVKDVSEQAKAKWYKANYEKARI